MFAREKYRIIVSIFTIAAISAGCAMENDSSAPLASCRVVKYQLGTRYTYEFSRAGETPTQRTYRVVSETSTSRVWEIVENNETKTLDTPQCEESFVRRPIIENLSAESQYLLYNVRGWITYQGLSTLEAVQTLPDRLPPPSGSSASEKPIEHLTCNEDSFVFKSETVETTKCIDLAYAMDNVPLSIETHYLRLDTSGSQFAITTGVDSIAQQTIRKNGDVIAALSLVNSVEQ